MFAGPNGSGKSTLFKGILSESLIGVYLNPDEIEQTIQRTGVFDPNAYRVDAKPEELLKFLNESVFLRSVGLDSEIAQLLPRGKALSFEKVQVSAYFASAISDFLRNRLLKIRESFTFETVMSAPDKIGFLGGARAAGYRTYLYYVATDDPLINESRVLSRVGQGGHSVPKEKIRSRYYRSLDLLPEAIRHSDRAYIFDNSGIQGDHTWLAEITDGKSLEIKTNVIPAWFKRAVLDKMSGTR